MANRLLSTYLKRFGSWGSPKKRVNVFATPKSKKLFGAVVLFTTSRTRNQNDKYILAIDEGTSSARVILYNSKKQPCLTYQKEFDSIEPHPGWVEQDPKKILDDVKECIEQVIKKASESGIVINSETLKGIGITNQRETSILWDSKTGEPLFNAIVWMDGRTAPLVHNLEKETGDKNYFRESTGLPISTYFSALKIKWMIDNVPEVRKAIKENRCMFGTVDSWLIWNLTGGIEGGVHITDVTNASRTNLMDIRYCSWDNTICDYLQIPGSILPKIKSSAEVYGRIPEGMFEAQISGVPISGCIGDQQAATLGQACLSPGEAKNTYGTGCFILMNTGTKIVKSNYGLLTTVAYQLGPDQPVIYALEGAVAVAGYGIKWLKDNLNLIQRISDISSLAASVPDSGGVYFVPAFGGLLAPYWRDDARGLIMGLTFSTTRAHIARAMLEAPCYQTTEIIEAMQRDSGIPISTLRVDGGMTKSDLVMQIQADLLGVNVERPTDLESTARGAAYVAGVGSGLWTIEDISDAEHNPPAVFKSTTTENERTKKMKYWQKAVKLTFGWES
eukprot:TRINITY_DN434_c0_g1_i1.p1 TRINITY_DN434_c0_g1~~TRINITY_DN434_c0_g1_i1.p1  ORF type:complete len:560 (+),score=95.01 TRINITY_DN434_c0_g1_i1:71-1750(+)